MSIEVFLGASFGGARSPIIVGDQERGQSRIMARGDVQNISEKELSFRSECRHRIFKQLSPVKSQYNSVMIGGVVSPHACVGPSTRIREVLEVRISLSLQWRTIRTKTADA